MNDPCALCGGVSSYLVSTGQYLCVDCLREDRNEKIRVTLDMLRDMDEADRICWYLGITREKFEELGGLDG